jgi:cysteine desulfurase/selenocysteine lyase
MTNAIISSSSSSILNLCFVVLPALFFVVSDGFVPSITTTSILKQQSSIISSPLNSKKNSFKWTQRLYVLQNPETTSTEEGNEDDSNSSDWWRGVKFLHGDVATKTRPDFAILSTSVGSNERKKPLVYLDSGATSHTPKQVIQDIATYYEEMNSNVHRGAHTLSRMATAAFEDARDTVAKFVNSYSRNEIIFTGGATEAINLVANSYGRSMLKEGDEILLTEMEHHSNLVPWQMIAKETGAVIRYVKIDFDKGGLDLDHMESLLNEKTKVVGFQHVSNVMGCINPVKEMVQIVRSKSPDAVILLDACQSVPHMRVDVQDLGIDFMAASGHKMCGPTGIGFLWGKEDLLNSMPPYMGGGEMIDQVTLEGSTFAQAPARFEAGTPPIAQAVGMASAIRYLEAIGMDNVEKYEHEIASYMYKRLSEVKGVTVLGPPEGVDRAALCAFYVDGVHPSDLSTFLDIEGVAIRAGHHCCQPLHQARDISHSARASLYMYNNKE